ncbi:MAG: 50S ribosomal protein L9 [Chloracidobacterium sp.]|nr:50S ribosomal protein L9 [Chloracidobacterium sp.]MDW8218152.1 50S ribosomal protein L9 [Acidobacteriota bacterium]
MAMMELLLKEDVEHLGVRGDIVKVRAGYGRNYLIPKGLALMATRANVKLIERERQRLVKLAQAELAAAQSLGEQLSALTLTFQRKAGEHGTLYGSVTSMDIAEELASRQLSVERRRIMLKEPIKALGEYEVPVKLHRDVTVTLKVVVVSDAPPAEKPAASSKPEKSAVPAAETLAE